MLHKQSNWGILQLNGLNVTINTPYKLINNNIPAFRPIIDKNFMLIHTPILISTIYLYGTLNSVVNLEIDDK